MSCFGGLSIVPCTLVCREWHSIILAFLVCCFAIVESNCNLMFCPFCIATSVDIEHVFSRGRLLLSHVRSHLSAQSTHSLLCVGNWSVRSFIKDSDVEVVAMMHDIYEDELEE